MFSLWIKPFGFLSGSKARSFLVPKKLWVICQHILFLATCPPQSLLPHRHSSQISCAPMTTCFPTSLFCSNIIFSIRVPWKIPSKIIITHYCFGSVWFIIFWRNLFIYNVYCLYLSPHLEYELHKDREYRLLCWCVPILYYGKHILGSQWLLFELVNKWEKGCGM